MNYYYFDNNQGALSVMVLARSANRAWDKLRRTHAYYFQRNGWQIRKRATPLE